MGRLAEERDASERVRSQLAFALLCELSDADSAAPALPPLVAAAIEEAVAGKAAEVSPQATGATWDKEVWLDYAGNVASTTFTLDDPASTVVTVVSHGGSLEAM